MANLPVYDKSGNKVGSYEIDPAEFAPSINKQLLHDVVLMYQANQRQGSFKSKGRSDVAGSTKKMYRQKGTGNARAGMRRTNIRRGGGHAFAKNNRDFSYRLPRKAVRQATRMAMAGKIQDEEVLIIDQLTMERPRTGEIAKLLKALDLEGKRALIATADYDQAVHRSARNIQDVSVTPVSDLNALSILRPDRVLVTRAAMDRLRTAAKQELATAKQGK
jgi:large subunit ribosomal protein L4